MIRYHCKLCDKIESVHNAVTKACPVGTNHRSVGYTSYHYENKFVPDPKKPIKEKVNFTL